MSSFKEFYQKNRPMGECDEQERKGGLVKSLGRSLFFAFICISCTVCIFCRDPEAISWWAYIIESPATLSDQRALASVNLNLEFLFNGTVSPG